MRYDTNTRTLCTWHHAIHSIIYVMDSGRLIVIQREQFDKHDIMNGERFCELLFFARFMATVLGVVGSLCAVCYRCTA